MIMLVDVSRCDRPFSEFTELLRQEGAKLGVDVHAQREEIFNAMHRL